MNRVFVSITVVAVYLIFMTLVGTGCAKRFFGKPPGTFVGSCTGIMELLGGDKTRFTFSLFKVSDNDMKIYLNLPERHIRYAPVSDITIDNKVIRVELDNHRKVYEGKIAGDSMEFRGEWRNYRGSLTLEVKE